MSFYNNNKHFLHQHLTFLESIDYDKGFENFLLGLGIPATSANYMQNKTVIDWTKVADQHKFYYDYEGCEEEVKNWLKRSILSSYEFLYTHLSFADPIIKIKTSDFIDKWEEFNLATGWDGLILTTAKGELFLEFAESPRDLYSNFIINPAK